MLKAFYRDVNMPLFYEMEKQNLVVYRNEKLI